MALPVTPLAAPVSLTSSVAPLVNARQPRVGIDADQYLGKRHYSTAALGRN